MSEDSKRPLVAQTVDLADSTDTLEMERRSFLLMMAGAASVAATAGAGGCGSSGHSPSFRDTLEGTNSVPTTFVPTVLSTGGGHVPAVARVQNGVAVLLEGIPALGSGVDVRTQGLLYSQHSVDRVGAPMMGGRAITWDVFYAKWREVVEKGGAEKRVRVLRQSTGSLTKKRLYDALLANCPSAQIHVWSGLGRDNVETGLKQAYKRSLWVDVKFEKADRVVAFGSDFLRRPRYAADFAARRRSAEDDKTFRFYAVESTATITGQAADHRLAIKPSELFVAMCIFAGQLFDRGVSGLDAFRAPPDQVTAFGPKRVDWLREMAIDFAGARGKSFVCVGPWMPAAAHALAAAINDSLGNVGKTVEYTAAIHPHEGLYCDDLASLTKDMNARLVDCLIIHGGNPVYDAPADIPFAEAMKKVRFIAHFTEEFNETSQKATSVLPQNTPLEGWDLYRDRDRILLRQPVVTAADCKPLTRGI